MKRIHLTAAATALAAILSGCADLLPAAPAPIPDTLKLPDSQILALKTQASGVQIYQCQPAKDDAMRFDWTLKAPEATLLDDAGNTVGKHYAGPSWEAIDGSKVVGEVKARDGGPDPAAIPWLLLAVKSSSGNGVLSAVQYVQRLYTIGGKAPAEGCDAQHAGTETRVPYKAAYYFYSPRP